MLVMNLHSPSITRCNQPLKNISNIRVRTAGSDQMAKRRRKKLSEVAIKQRIIRSHLNEHGKFYRRCMMKAWVKQPLPKMHACKLGVIYQLAL